MQKISDCNNMSYLSPIPMIVESCDENFIQNVTVEEVRAQHNSLQNYECRTITLDDTNCIYQNNNLHKIRISNWVEDCQVMGFLQDRPTHNISTPGSFPRQCSYSTSLNFQNIRNDARNFSTWCSTKLAGNKRANLKRKRNRTVFTTEQIIALEGIFQRKPYVNREERIAMMERLQVSEKSIKVWFQNRRRMTDKKCQEYTADIYSSDSPSSVDTPDSFSDRLTFIETQIKENTDENGYVTLNDYVMSELVSVIDDYLSKDVNFCDTDSVYNINNAEYRVMYEPISPASSEEMYD